jgi:DNA-3-methyladenine glycosylase II
VKPATLSAATLRRAEAHLVAADPVMAKIIAAVGRCRLAQSRRADPFTAMIEAIIWQQLSTKAAATIYGRFIGLFPADGPPSPAAILALEELALRGAGLSRAKVLYLRDLAAKVLDGSLPLATLDRLSDEEVIDALVRVKGIGRWSAEMFLMFRLQRPDVMPVGDLGIVKAMQRNYRLRRTPTPARMLKIAEPWRPYRSVAAWYLWASGDVVPGAS